jgi:signal transduction histidine kinase
MSHTTIEQPLIIHLHWSAFARDIAFIVAGVVLPPVFVGIILPNLLTGDVRDGLGQLLPLGLGLWALSLWIVATLVWTKYYLSLWILTDKYIVRIDQNNLFDRQIAGWNMNTIREVSTSIDDMMGTSLDYGTVIMKTTTAGDDEYIVARNIPHVESVGRMILEHIRTYTPVDVIAKQESLLRTVSHEMKGHLARSEATFAAILQGDFGDVPEPLKHVASEALADSRTGVETVMNILDSANLKRGTLSYVMTRFDLLDAVRESIVHLRHDAEQKGLTLTLHDTGHPVWIEGDRQKIIHHVLRNLIDNAIRYTIAGTITICVTCNDIDAQFSVTDTGVGIKPEDMPHLFTEGGRGKDSTQVNPASTGYGLYVAKQVVEGHGGRIWAESNGAGTGSTFFVVFPIHAPHRVTIES